MAVNNPFAARDQMLQHMLQAPWLPQISSQLQSVLEAEQEKRQRCYEEMSEEDKTEFINGEVIVQTPVKLRHSQAGESLFSLLSLHVSRHDLGYVGHEKLLVCLTRNDYEPDICFFGKEKARSFKPNQTKFPAPDFVVEILSQSTEAVDRGVKFEDYAFTFTPTMPTATESSCQLRIRGTYNFAGVDRTFILKPGRYFFYNAPGGGKHGNDKAGCELNQDCTKLRAINKDSADPNPEGVVGPWVDSLTEIATAQWGPYTAKCSLAPGK